MRRQCLTCTYFYEMDHETGQCRRNPPLPQLMGNTIDYTPDGFWPEISKDNWCGEYKRKENKKLWEKK